MCHIVLSLSLGGDEGTSIHVKLPGPYGEEV